MRRILIASALLLFGAAVVTALVYHSKPVPPQAQPDARPAALADPSALVRFHSPSIGEPTAKVHIVEFFDPACATCRDFYPFVKSLMDAHPGRIRLSVRYAPFHRGSDEVVKMLEAARRQGKYWPALEAILATQPRWVVNHTARAELAWPALEGLGLDLARLKADMSSQELAQIIRQDLEDAAKLGVDKTPEFFVNGRPMPRFGYEELKGLVDRALRDAYG